MPLLRKKEGQPLSVPIDSTEDELLGYRADIALLQNLWGNPDRELPDPNEFRSLSDESKALVQGFLSVISSGIKENDPKLFVDGWRGAKTLVDKTRKHNKQVYLSRAERKIQMGVQLSEFQKQVKKIFGKNSLITVDGENVVSTREGGLWWGIRHWANVFLNPQSRTYTRVENGNGTEYSASKKDYGVDTSLFDDFFLIGFRGIKFYNPDLDDEGVLYEWYKIGDLAYSFNTSKYLDYWNSRVKPLLGKNSAQKQFSPFGVLKIADRPGKRVLVRIPMRNPEQFVKKLERISEAMRDVAVRPEDLEERPYPYIEIEHFMQALPPSMREEVMAVFEETRRGNRYSTKDAVEFMNSDSGSRQSSEITMGNSRGGEFISWEELERIVNSNEHQELIGKLSKIRDRERNRQRRANLGMILDRVSYMVEKILENRSFGAN